ncbi:MAG: WD40/YVTN/BNR-like repeat-containing protein [Flavobacteriales bacterium]
MFKLILCLIFPFLSVAQVKVFFPKTGSKEHERALISSGNGQILSGSSEANIRLHGANGQVLQNSQLGASFKEIRDLAQTPNGFIALQSHDSSGLVLLNKALQIDTIIYPLGKRSDLFLDGICAQGNLVFLLGDPLNGKFSTFRSFDSGLTWEATPGQIAANDGEAAYAASGQTNQMLNGHFYFVSGGLTSRFFHSADQGETWSESTLPYPSCTTCGPYAMAIKNEKEIMTVGGSYLESNTAQNTCFYSQDGGLTWKAPKRGPSGYRSCVVHTGKSYYSCGTNGIDVSKNGGKTWKQISNVNALSMTFSNGKLYVTLMDGSWLLLDVEK